MLIVVFKVESGWTSDGGYINCESLVVLYISACGNIGISDCDNSC